MSFFKGVHAQELEAMSGFMETIYGSSIRGFGEDKMCWILGKDKGFMVNDYYRILVGLTIYGFGFIWSNLGYAVYCFGAARVLSRQVWSSSKWLYMVNCSPLLNVVSLEGEK